MRIAPHVALVLLVVFARLGTAADPATPTLGRAAVRAQLAAENRAAGEVMPCIGALGFGAPLEPAHDIVCDASGEFLVAAAGDRAWRVDGVTGITLGPLPGTEGRRLYGLGVSRGGETAAAVAPKGGWLFWWCRSEGWACRSREFGTHALVEPTVSARGDMIGIMFAAAPRIAVLTRDGRVLLDRTVDAPPTALELSEALDSCWVALQGGRVVRYAVGSGREVASRELVGADVASLALSPDGSKLACTSVRGALAIVDPSTLAGFETRGVSGLVLASDWASATRVLTFREGEGYWVFDCSTREILETKTFIAGFRMALASGPQWVFLPGNGGRYDASVLDARGRLTSRMPAGTPALMCSSPREGGAILAETTPGDIGIWRKSDGALIGRVASLPRYVDNLAISADGEVLAVTTIGHECSVHLLAAGEARVAPLPRSPPGVSTTAVSPDGRLVAAAGEAGCFALATKSGAGAEWAHELRSRSTACRFDGSSCALAVGGEDGTVTVLDPRHEAGSTVSRFGVDERRAPVAQLEWLPDARLVVRRSGRASAIELLDLRSGEFRPFAQNGSGRPVAVSPDGASIAVFDDQPAAMTLFDVATARPRAHRLVPEAVRAAIWDRDGLWAGGAVGPVRCFAP
jgi:WD40 repeat protein